MLGASSTPRMVLTASEGSYGGEKPYLSSCGAASPLEGSLEPPQQETSDSNDISNTKALLNSVLSEFLDDDGEKNVAEDPMPSYAAAETKFAVPYVGDASAFFENSEER